MKLMVKNLYYNLKLVSSSNIMEKSLVWLFTKI